MGGQEYGKPAKSVLLYKKIIEWTEMTRRITECGLLRNRTEMKLRAGEQPAPDLQCAEAHEYKNFLATPAHNLEKAGLRLTKQKSGKRANDGRATCAGL